MNNFCRNCGEKLEDNIKVCPKCGAEVFEEKIDVEQKQVELENFKKKENFYIFLIIGLFAFGYGLPIIFDSIYKATDSVELYKVYNAIKSICSLLSLAGIITAIYARVTMHDSTKIKVLFRIIIVLVILFLIYAIWVVILCSSAMGSFRGCY